MLRQGYTGEMPVRWPREPCQNAPMIDPYCERVAPGLLAEPLNALTNLAFLVAAFMAWRLAVRRNVLDRSTGCLVLLVGAIGVGSFLFHTFATGWALAADVIPILLFQVCFLWVYSARVLGLGIVARIASAVALIAAIHLAGRHPDLLNGSVGYLPALLTLILLGTAHWWWQAVEPRLLLTASGVLALSLAARTADLTVCAALPVGSHFLWHLFNGVVLYLVMRALLLNLTPPKAVP